MNACRRAALSIIVTLLCSPLVTCGASSRDIAVDRYDVALTVLADGSLSVQEAVTARALGTGARFTRDIPRVQIDEIFDVSAAVDGAPLVGAAGDARINRWGTLQVRWSPATQAKTLQLHYRLAGALEAQETRGLLHWPALPAMRSYSVAAARVTLTVPHGAVFASGPLINDARMSVAAGGSGFVGDLRDIDQRQSVLVSGEIELGTLSMAEPNWQTSGAQAWRLMPAFLAGATCLIAIAIGVVVMIWLQYGSEPSSAKSGFADAERLAVRRGLRQTGWVAIALAIAGAVAIQALLSRLGIWPMAIPVSLVVMGVLFIRAAGRIRY